MRVWLTSLVVAVLGGCLGAVAEDADSVLDRCFHDYLDATARLRPSVATQLGDHRYDDLLEDVTPSGRARVSAMLGSTLATLNATLDPEDLTADGRVDYEIFRGELERLLWLEETTDPWTTDPRIYNSLITDSVYLLLTQSSLPLEANVTNALARLRRIPAIVEAARANLKRPPRPHTETAIRQNQGAIAFYEGGLAVLAKGSLHEAELAQAGKAVAGKLREYQRFLEDELLPRADGEWRLGPERFSRKLEMTLDAGLEAREVVEEAEVEYRRVRGEMAVISRQLWSRYYAGQPLPPEDGEGRQTLMERVLLAVGREHGEAGDLTRDVTAIVQELRTFIREQDILRLPEPDQCAVIEMPEFQRGNSTAYLNPAPPLDPRGGSYYAVSPPPADWSAAKVTSYLEEYNRHMLHILSIHEAYPGHYVQLEYANRHPSLIRRVIGSGPFVEGWAVYTEQMMLDQGYGHGDLALRLTQLKFYLRAVINALLDHRMHCTTMTDAEAMELLMTGGFQSEGEARLKVIRAKQSSCQLSTYFVGRMALHRLRQAVQRECGDRFELGRFHETVLSHGSLPPRHLPELVRAAMRAED